MTRAAPLILLALAGTCLGEAYAAQDLGIAMDSVSVAMTEAAQRTRANIDFSAFMCRDGQNDCHWDSEDAVYLTASRVSGPNAYQFMVAWNSGSKASRTTSASTYKALCSTIVAAVRPDWLPSKVQDVIRRIALMRPGSGDQEVEFAGPGVVFFGARSIPSNKSFPNEALVQCGVRADFAK